MSIEAIEPVVQSLHEFSLLSGAQLEEAARDLAPRCADARMLAQELIRRDWLTPFQANRLLQGKGRELLLGLCICKVAFTAPLCTSNPFAISF
jgi:hypothetical protein